MKPGDALATKNEAEAEAARKSAEKYGLESLFGVHSGPPSVCHGRCKDCSSCMDLELLTLNAYLSPGDNGVKTVEIRSRYHFDAISALGHLDVLIAANARTTINEVRGTGKTMTRDIVGCWD